jgi:hypothetical protein
MGDFDGPLLDWKDKGHQVELIGLEEIEGTEVYRLKVTMNNGDVHNHYVDSKAFFTIRQDGKSMMQSIEVEFETTVSDYREVAGLMLPHSFESRVKGAPAGQVITVSEITVNPEVSDDLFVMPEKEESAEEEE